MYSVAPWEAAVREREMQCMGRSLLWGFVMTMLVCDSELRPWTSRGMLGWLQTKRTVCEVHTLWNKWGLAMKRMGRVHPFLWIWVVAEEWLGQNCFVLFLSFFLPPWWTRSLVLYPGSALTPGTRHLCWEWAKLGNSAGRLDYLSEWRQRYMCSFAWSFWFPAPESSNPGDWFSGNRSDCEGGLSPAHSCQCRQTSKQAVQGLLSGFLWGQGLVGAHCTWFLKLMRKRSVQNASTLTAGRMLLPRQ